MDMDRPDRDLDFEDDAAESELDDELGTVSAVEVGPLLMQR